MISWARVERRKLMILSAVICFFSLASFTSSLDVSACGDLNAADTYYKLTQNVEAEYTCFNITASNVTLDCQGFNINYSTTIDYGFGVNVSGQNNTVIKNCHLNATNQTVNQPTAIYLNNASNSQIYNNTIAVNSTNDIAIWVEYDSNNNSITNNTIIDSYWAVYFKKTNKNTFENNNITSILSAASGVYAEDTSNSTFKNNNITLADSAFGLGVGVLSSAGDYNIIENNNVHVGDDSLGIYSQGFQNTVDGNKVYLTNSGVGFQLYAANNNLVTNGIVNSAGNGNTGVDVGNSNQSTISNFIIKADVTSSGTGIRVLYNSFHNVFSNISIENFTRGIDASGNLGICNCLGGKVGAINNVENTFEKITVNNTNYGFYATNYRSFNCWCPFPPPGHWGYYPTFMANKNTLTNSIISNADAGIWVNGSNENTFTYNTINNSINAVYLTSHHPVSGNSFKSNAINNASNCVFLDARNLNSINSNSFYNNKLSSCDYGIRVSDASYDNVFADSVISQSSTADVHSSLVSPLQENTFLNTTFNKTNATIVEGAIKVQWYLKTRVVDTSGSGIENAEVNISDSSGTLLYSLATGADGYAQTQNITEFWQDSSDFQNYTPHTVSAKINPSASATTQMTENREVILTLDYLPPVISNVRITDVTQNTVTIAWDTSKPANETIEYGTDSSYGTNYTNAALSTTHSVFITGLNKATTYHYKIHACGTTNCASTSDATFTTVSETGGYGGGGGGALPAAPTATPTTPAEAPSEAPATPPAAPAITATPSVKAPTPQAVATPSVEVTPTAQPTAAGGPGANAPLIAVTVVAIGVVAYLAATRLFKIKF